MTSYLKLVRFCGPDEDDDGGYWSPEDPTVLSM